MIFKKDNSTKNIDLTKAHIVKLKNGKYVIRIQHKDGWVYLDTYKSRFQWNHYIENNQFLFLIIAKYYLKKISIFISRA